MTPRCECCDKPASVIFRPTRFRRDDVCKVCDRCIAIVCDDCSETDDEGRVECVSCMQTDAIRRKESAAQEAGRAIEQLHPWGYTSDQSEP